MNKYWKIFANFEKTPDFGGFNFFSGMARPEDSINRYIYMVTMETHKLAEHLHLTSTKTGYTFYTFYT